MGIRRLARSRGFQGRPTLILVDALASFGAFQRGRSSAPTLRLAVRHARAVPLAADVRPRKGYTLSEYNPADPLSRGHRLEKRRWKAVGGGLDTRTLRRLVALEVSWSRLRNDNRSRRPRATASSVTSWE